MNEFTYGQKINTPIAIARSVSFQKIRQGSLSSRTQKVPQNSQPQKPLQPAGLCQKLMSKKLISNQMQSQRNPLQTKVIQNNQLNKVEAIKKQLQQKQMKQCTFKPKVNKNSNPQRTLQQFIGQQTAYEKQKQDKVNQMREMIRAKMDKQNTFQPNVINNNNNGYQKRCNEPVHQRLYEQSTKRNQSKQSMPQSLQKRSNGKFTTQRKLTTYSRKGSQKSIVESCLGSRKYTLQHNDPSQFNSSIPNISESSKQVTQIKQDSQCGSSRQEPLRSHSSRSHSQKGLKVTKYMDVQQVCDRKLHNKKIIQERETKKVSTKNKQMYIKKILREISLVLSQLNINQIDLNYMQMSQILQKMNFIDEQSNINDRKYLFQIWQMLQGDVYESCPLANLIKIIFCLLGCHDFHIVEECLAMVMEEGPTNKRLVLTQKQSKSIKANFQQLSLNRLKKGQFTSAGQKNQQFSFKPFISKNSVQMAQKYRQRVIQQSQQLLNNNLIKFQVAESGQVDHVDLLYLDDKRKQLKMRLKRQQHERERKRLEDQAMQGEKISKSKSKPYQSYESVSSRFQHLYQLGKQNIRNKNQRLPQAQQMPKQCTFQPNIGKSKQNSCNRFVSKQNSLYHSNNGYETTDKRAEEIKDFDKSIFRMYEGRRIRQQTNMNPSKSISDKSISQNQQRSRDDDTPFLYLNINMAGYDDVKVPVFHSDNMKTITQKVKILMGLQYAEDYKLEQVLRLQIVPTLKQIGMNIDLQ